MHLLATICAHGFGHLGQSAPVLNALRRPLPALRLTVASTLPEARLRRDMFASWCLAGHALNGRLYGFESVATCGRFGSSLDSHSTELVAWDLSSGLMMPVS